MGKRQIAIVTFLLAAACIGCASAEQLKPCEGTDSSTWDACIGTINYDNGSTYTGEFKKGLLTGYGKYTYAATPTTPAGQYEGEFLNGFRHGRGTYIFSTGIIYVGENKNNNFEGKGKITYPNGDFYEGEFFEGLFQGKGKMTFAIGISWDGNWYGGSPQGLGSAQTRQGKNLSAKLDFSRGKMLVLDNTGAEIETIDIFTVTEAQKNTADVNALMTSGYGIQAKDRLIATLNSTPTDNKLLFANALNDVLDVCMITGDTTCFYEQFDAYPNALFESLKGFDTNSESKRELLDQTTDSAIAKFSYRALLSLDEAQLKDTTSWTEYVYPGSPTGLYAGMRAAIDARAALFVGKRLTAEDNQRRARFFITQNGLRTLAGQMALILTLENDLYHFNDAEEVRRFLIHCSDETDNNDISGLFKACANSDFLNPYIYARLLHLFIDSGSLSGETEIEAIESLHFIYRNLEIVEGGVVDFNRESLYAYLSIRQTFGEILTLSFNPKEQLEELKLDSPDGIGTKAYLLLFEALQSAGSRDDGKLNKAQSYLTSLIDTTSRNISQSGERGRLYQTPSVHILKALLARSHSNEEDEVFELERYTQTKLERHRAANISAVNRPPSLAKFDYMIAKYVIDRFNLLSPNNPKLLDYALFVSAAADAATDGNIQRSYNLLSLTNDHIQRQMIRTFIALEERYARYLGTRYATSSLGRHANETHANPKTIAEIQPSSGDHFQQIYERTRRHLETFRSIENPIFNINSDYLPEITEEDETIFFVSDAGTFSLVIQFNKIHWDVWILNSRALESVRDSLKILQSKQLKDYTAEEISTASKNVSSVVFQKEFPRDTFFSFLTGPTVFGIPYSLLTNPFSGEWLIKSNIPRAFESAIHKNLSMNKKSAIVKHSYLAFANPKLRSRIETTKISAVEMMIRGTDGDVADLSELPETEAEARSFGQQYRGDTRYFFGDDANIDNLFSQNFDEVEVLSFNTHGVMAGEIAGNMSSSVVLSKTAKNNGLIPETWLFSIYGAPRVTMLMTCNSGSSSQNLKGVEIKSLADVFLMKGSDAVISSYWQVNSIATSQLTRSLAILVSEGQPWSKALTIAARNLIGSEEWNHPAEWAAFIISGDYQAKHQESIPAESEVLTTLKGTYSSRPLSLPTGTLFNIWEGNRLHHYSLQQTKSDYKFLKGAIGNGDTLTIHSSNIENNQYIGIVSQDKIEFSRLDKTSSELPLLCIYQSDTAFTSKHLPNDFIVTKDRIFLLTITYESTDAPHPVRLISLNRTTCKAEASKELVLASNGLGDVKIFPSRLENHLILTTTTYSNRSFSLDRSKRRSDHGFAMFCRDQQNGKHFLFNSSLNITKEKTNRNIRFLDSPTAKKDGVNAIMQDPCIGNTIARIIKNEWFEEDFLIMDELGYDKRYEQITPLEMMLSATFGNIVRYWQFSDYLGDIVYVSAYVGFLMDDDNIFGPNGTSEDTRLKRLELDGGMYAFSARTGKNWRKLYNDQECGALSFPLSFQGAPIVACMLKKNGLTSNTIEIRRY